MAHPRVPHPYAICVIAARALVLCLAIVNMGGAAYLASEHPEKNMYGVGTAVTCAIAIFVDAPPIAALLDSHRKVRRPPTSCTACFDLLLAAALVCLAVFLLMSDYYYRNGSNSREDPPWAATLGIVALMTLVHAACRVFFIFWAMIYGCVKSSGKRKAERRAESLRNGQQPEAEAPELELGGRQSST